MMVRLRSCSTRNRRRGPPQTGSKAEWNLPNPALEPYAFILGGNANTLAFTSSLVPENRQITAWLGAARVDADRVVAR